MRFPLIRSFNQRICRVNKCVLGLNMHLAGGLFRDSSKEKFGIDLVFRSEHSAQLSRSLKLQSIIAALIQTLSQHKNLDFRSVISHETRRTAWEWNVSSVDKNVYDKECESTIRWEQNLIPSCLEFVENPLQRVPRKVHWGRHQSFALDISWSLIRVRQLCDNS